MLNILASKNTKIFVFFFYIILNIITISKNILVLPFKSTNLEIEIENNAMVDDILSQIKINYLLQ